MQVLPQTIADAIESLSDLPGIGSRSAERLVLSLLKNKSGLDQKIAESIGNLKKNIHECQTCFHFCESENETCCICDDSGRDQNVLCIVESPLDLVALERTHEFKGNYHVLHGIISPLNRVLPEDLRIGELITRVQDNKDIGEIILALSGTTESEATAMFIAEQLKPFFKGKVSRLSRGIPSGGDLDYLDMSTLSRAMSERREF